MDVGVHHRIHQEIGDRDRSRLAGRFGGSESRLGLHGKTEDARLKSAVTISICGMGVIFAIFSPNNVKWLAWAEIGCPANRTCQSDSAREPFEGRLRRQAQDQRNVLHFANQAIGFERGGAGSGFFVH
jgi:hypothetical protein